MKNKQKAAAAKNIKTPFLKGISPKFRDLLFQKASVKEFSEGDFIFKDGEKADKFYLVLKGKVNILAEEQDVRFDTESTTGILQTLQKGDVVGWSWVIPPYRWRFDARAAADTQLLVFDGERVRKLMAKNNSFGCEIYRRLAPVMNQRLVASRLKLQIFGGRPFSTVEGG